MHSIYNIDNPMRGPHTALVTLAITEENYLEAE
jgi:hypothetical protein